MSVELENVVDQPTPVGTAAVVVDEQTVDPTHRCTELPTDHVAEPTIDVREPVEVQEPLTVDVKPIVKSSMESLLDKLTSNVTSSEETESQRADSVASSVEGTKRPATDGAPTPPANKRRRKPDAKDVKRVDTAQPAVEAIVARANENTAPVSFLGC